MKVSDIIHWEFDVRTRKFESYNDPVNDYVPDRPVTIEEYLDVIHSEDRSSAMDAGGNAFLTKPLKKSQLMELFKMKW